MENLQDAEIKNMEEMRALQEKELNVQVIALLSDLLERNMNAKIAKLIEEKLEKYINTL